MFNGLFVHFGLKLVRIFQFKRLEDLRGPSQVLGFRLPQAYFYNTVTGASTFDDPRS